MAVASPSTYLAMTEQQRQSFDEQGFIVIQDFFSEAEFSRLLTAIDEVAARVRAEKGLGENDPFALRNALTQHEAFLDLIDNPRILPLVVDAIGWNIQIRTTHLDYRPPYPQDLVPGELGTGEGADHTAGYKNLVWHPDLAGPYLFEAPSLDGRLPFMEIKVGYYLSDLRHKNSGAICLVPGSHKRTPQELRDLNHRELATALPFVVMVLVMGVFPGFFLDRLQTSTQRYVARAQVGLDMQQRDEDTRVTVLPLPSSAPVVALPAGASARR